MKFEIDVIGHSLTDGEITAFEAGAKVRLPPQYRDFLKGKNGFLPLQMICPDTGFDADLSVFFPLFSMNKRTTVNTVECVNDLIWFAIDSGGGRYGLAHTGRNFGKVFWFDLPHSDIEQPMSSDCEIVADTFNAFIESLIPMVD
ncbi:SMI1/KNR4 family protein [Aestuariibius sp. HNIBRBA575]|uniref:SMI1/KNR4 family protein n=1 Tax=Aestuariibius sp. HNIBRBA575 TaxID=3233343 RepID=UPI0034A1595C